MLDDSLEVPQNTKWTTQMRSYAVERYLKTGSYTQTIGAFQSRFDPPKPLYKSLIVKWVMKFRQAGTLGDLRPATPGHKTHSGRKRIRSDEMLAQVRESVEKSPGRSSRKRCQELDLTRSTMLRVMRKDLKKFPYRISIHQSLSEVQKIDRMVMSKVLMEKIEHTSSFLDNLWTSDEAHCYLDNQINSKNNIFWGDSKPDLVATKSLHSKKVTVWCALSSRGIIGPYFFEENGKPLTINTERYLKVLDQFWKQLKKDYPEKYKYMWFQQDGATPHTSDISLQWLKERFNSRIVSRRSTIQWPPHSPDLSPPDFFLWGYLKGKIYANNPTTLLQLKKNITEVIRGIQKPMLKSVMQNFALRLKNSVDRKGAHIEHVIKKT